MKLLQWRDSVVPYPEADAERFRTAGFWGDLTIAGEFHQVALRTPDAVALIGPDRCYTYAELDRETDRIGAGLLQLGLTPGQAVLLQLDNSEDTVLAWYGVLKAALIPVATLSVHRGHEIRQIAARTRAAAHLVQGDLRKFDLVRFATDLAAGSPRLVLTVRDHAGPRPGTTAVEGLGEGLSADQARMAVSAAQSAVDPDDVAVFQLSGGTTGTPKVIPRLHAEYWYNARAYAERLGWDATVRVAQLMPLVHNAGIVCGLHAAHSVGGTIVVGSPDADRALPLLARAAVTDGLMLPGLAATLRAHPLFDAAFAKAQRVVLSGSAISDGLFEAFERRGVQVVGLFGMGEGMCMVTPPADPEASRQHTVGFPLSAADEVRLLEPGTETAVPDGTPGEFCARGPYTLRGYLDAPERNAEAFTTDGFYRTGDLLAVRDIGGLRRYVFEGRVKDLVVRGGEKINAAEIEGLITQLPGIRRAALIPVPDPRLGERGCLCLELEDGAAPIGLADVQQFLERREVARFKWPERVELIAELPRTLVGKVDKKRLIAELDKLVPHSPSAAAQR